MNKLLNDFIELSPSYLIASGRHRACYQHPLHENLCIKVHHANDDEEIETLREVRYYQRLYKRKIIPTTISKYYGTQRTNLGKGYVFQLIKDKTGSVSQTLGYYLNDRAKFLKYKKNIGIAYKNFKKTAYKDAITTMTLKTYNIVYQLGYKPYGQFFIIDNLGSANLIHLDYYSKIIARSTLVRRFTDFEKRIYRDYGVII